MDLRLLTWKRFRLPTLAECKEYWRRLPRNVRHRVFDALALLVVGCGLLLVHRHFVSGPVIPPGARAVSFPRDYSLGTLATCYWGEWDEYAHALGEAQGKVVVPAGKELVLTVDFKLASRPLFWQRVLRWFGFNVSIKNVPVRGDFSDLADLGRHDLHGLVVPKANQVRDSDMKYIGRMTSLRTLNISQQLITDAGAPPLARLTALCKLDLSRNRGVGSDALVHLRGCKSLQDLNLSRTQVGDAGLAHLAGLTSLTTLNLIGTRITDRGLENLRHLRSLTTLRLSHNTVRGRGLSHLRDLPKLQYLDLAHTLFRASDGPYLAGFDSLRILDLRGNDISEEGLKPLAELKSLRHVALGDGPSVIDRYPYYFWPGLRGWGIHRQGGRWIRR